MNSGQSSWDHDHRQSCSGTSLTEFSDLPTPEFVDSPALQQDSMSSCDSNCWGATVSTGRDSCVLCNMAVPLEEDLAQKCVCHRAVASETNNPACLKKPARARLNGEQRPPWAWPWPDLHHILQLETQDTEEEPSHPVLTAWRALCFPAELGDFCDVYRREIQSASQVFAHVILSIFS